MRKPLFKEVILLSLPLLVVGAIAFWQFRKPLTDNSISLVPAVDATIGELRLEFGEWKDVAPSAGEVATGHTVKKLGRVWLAGYDALALDLQNFYTMSASDFKLQFRYSGKWHDVRHEGGWNGIRETRFESDGSGDSKLQNQKFALALPLSMVPKDALEVRLKGRMRLKILRILPKKSQEKDIATPEVSFTIWKKGEPWPNPDVSQKGGVVVSNVQSPFMGIAANYTNGSDDFLPGAKVTMTLDSRVVPWKSELKSVYIRPQSLQLLDKKGRNWLRIAPPDGFGNAPPEQGASTAYGQDVRVYGLGNIALRKPQNCQFDISTLHIPKSAGELSLNAKISLLDDTNKTSDWPAEFNAIVRPQWLCQQPTNLKLKSVRLTNRDLPRSATRVTQEMFVPCIEAELEYTGKKVLFPRGDIISKEPDPMTIENEIVCAQIPFGRGGHFLDRNRRMRGAGEDELICSWSQHITDSNGEPTTKVFGDQISDTNILLEKPEIYKVQSRTYVKVRYYLFNYIEPETPHFFKAEIGIRDEGMIDISVPLQ